MPVNKVAILTAGGLAPCLSSAVGGLIERYTAIAPDIEILCYRSGYKGLLMGDRFSVSREVRESAHILHKHGGSPIGNSRVKLTNVEDCLRRGLVQSGQRPLEVAAKQLERDGVGVLHTIGGDDTNLSASELASYLAGNNYDLTVVGLPKTIDNDIIPVRQSLGASAAAEQGARFFENVVAEHSANPRMMIIHEVMGRHCGWLTAATAVEYRKRLNRLDFLPRAGLSKRRRDVHAVFLPELNIDLEAETARLRRVMDEIDNVNVFISEGAGVETIIDEMEASGQEVPRDAFGHAKLDAVNPGQWFAKQFASRLGAEKVLVQKSGYFSRAAPANAEDLRLIKSCVDLAVDCALNGIEGVIGQDEERGDQLRAIEFSRIKGGKPFDVDRDWFEGLLSAIGQPKGGEAIDNPG